MTVKEIKSELMVRNSLFYEYLKGKISIGKLCDKIARIIVNETKRSKNG